MKLSEIENRLVAWYLSSNIPKGPSFHLQSGPGRGKTSVLETLPEVLGEAFPGKRYGVAILNGACFTLSTATGYLWPEEHDGIRYSRFTRPDWWCKTQTGEPLEAFDGGVIVVDEEDKLGPDEKKIMGEAALSKRVASHDLPPGWVVWFAGNSAKDRSGSTKDFDHLLNRRNRIEVDDDLASLVAFMKRNDCLAETIVFAQEHPEIVFSPMPEKQGPWMTPRSLVAADTHLQALMAAFGTDKVPTDALTMEEIGGGVGEGAAAALFATIRLGQELPAYEDIVAKPKTIPVPERTDARMMAIYKLAARVSKVDATAVVTYIKRLGDEFAVPFVAAATKRDPALILTPAFRDWCAENSTLVALLQTLK